jgi:hypothetical protein
MGDGVSTESRREDHVRAVRGPRAGRTLRMGFVLDVAGWGSRPAPLRSDVQRRLPLLVSELLKCCGTDLRSVEHEWTGDGVNAIMPADADPSTALPILIRALAALLGEHNARSSDRIRLRMAVGIGLVENTSAGFGGPMIIDMSRMVNSAPLREALSAHPGADLVAAISDQVYSAIIRPGYPGIPGSQFTRVEVAEKEFSGPAWIWVSTRQWTRPAFGPLAPADPRAIGGTDTERYQLIARLGTGPSGSVYLAAAPGGPGADGWLAVKVYRPEATADAEARCRLADGVKSAATVRGPHVAGFVSGRVDPGPPWIAAALAPGPSLAEVVAETGPLPARPALWLAAGLARGLADIHDAGVTHGALHPSNVVISPSGPVITDAGTGSAVLSVGDGAEFSPAADVLALGCVAFYAATGRVPYGDSPASAGRVPFPSGEPDLSGCPLALLPVALACLLPAGERPPARALISQLEAAAGPAPRRWLPPVVAARCADYMTFPHPPGPRGLRAWHLRPSWPATRRGHRHGR